jgi:SAM-dependent methyltransferase
VGAARGRPDRVRHPLFARMYVRAAAQMDRAGAAEHREQLLAGLSGRVVELGAGHGLNFRRYPAAVDEVVAVEPEPLLREHATVAAAEAPVPVTVVDGTASALPLDDDTFDAAVSSLVLCSVPNQGSALGELRRVLRPGGELRFYEHVVASTTGYRWMQRLADHTIWPHVAGGCHAARDTAAAIEAAGFVIERCERFRFAPMRGTPTSPHILGVARNGPVPGSPADGDHPPPDVDDSKEDLDL